MHRGTSFYKKVGACAAVLSVLAMAAAPLAHAAPAAISQHGTPPALAQQPTPPASGTGAGGGGQGVLGDQAGGGDRGSGGQGAAGTEAQTAGDGGTLPFTGYPMTMLIWLALILIGVGICVRLGGAAYRHLRAIEARTF